MIDRSRYAILQVGVTVVLGMFLWYLTAQHFKLRQQHARVLFETVRVQELAQKLHEFSFAQDGVVAPVFSVAHEDSVPAAAKAADVNPSAIVRIRSEPARKDNRGNSIMSTRVSLEQVPLGNLIDMLLWIEQQHPGTVIVEMSIEHAVASDFWNAEFVFVNFAL